MHLTKKTSLSIAFAALSSVSLIGQTFTATHDAFVVGGTPNDNFGSSDSLTATSVSSRKAYIQFDLSSITDPIDTATLSFDVRTSPVPTFTFNVYGLNDGVTGEVWDESTITFNNAPGNASGFSAVDAAETTLVDSFDLDRTLFPVGNTVTLSSTQIADYLNSDTNGIVSFLIVRQTSGSQGSAFYSKENTASAIAPTLTITTTIPEPSTYALLGGLAAISLVAWRKRKRA